MEHYEKNKKSCLIHKLQNFEERFRIALKAAKICVFEVNLVKQCYTYFENAEDIFGITGEQILSEIAPYSALPPHDYRRAVSEYFSHPDDEATIAAAFGKIFAGQSTTYEARMRAGGCDYIWCKLDVTPVLENGVPVRMVGVITDISAIKARTDELEQTARSDIFTGLYNKQSAVSLIRSVFSHESTQIHALVLFDLDGFKDINDTFGHAAGDRVLKAVSENIKALFRKTDIIGRFGGDEFLLLLRDIPNQHFLEQKLHLLGGSFDNPYHITKSIGVSIFPTHGTDFDELFEKADKALYRAKKTKNSFMIYGEF